MENIITLPAKLGSNNPKAYGIVNAKEVSGHKQVSTLAELFSLPSKILSSSGNNTNNDAIGQEWWVQEKNASYRLTDWNQRDKMSGWSVSGITYINGTRIVISDESPADPNAIWADGNEYSIPEYENEDLQSIQAAIRQLHEIVGKH